MTTVTKYTTTAAAGAEVHARAERHMSTKGGTYREAVHAFSRPTSNWPKPTRNRLRE